MTPDLRALIEKWLKEADEHQVSAARLDGNDMPVSSQRQSSLAKAKRLCADELEAALASRGDGGQSQETCPVDTKTVQGNGGPDLRAWQPISTAPKDGTRLLLARQQVLSGELTMVSGCWNSGGAMHMPHWMSAVLGFQPTHWIPLPLPPAQEPSV